MASQLPVFSSTLTTESRSIPLALISFNVAAQAPLKLTSSNYLSWSLQFSTLLTRYDLIGYIDGTHPCPPSTITINDIPTFNPTQHHWIRQDQLILNALISSFTPTLIPFIATARTSYNAWQTFARTYGKPSRGWITQLKTQLNQLVKGSTSITEFMQNIKIRMDELSLMNALIDFEDLTIKIFHGLDDDYRELANAIQARDTCISFEKLHEKLLTHNTQILGAKSTHVPLLATGHVTTKVPLSASSPISFQLFNPHQPRPYLGRCQLCDHKATPQSVAPSLFLVSEPLALILADVNSVINKAILPNDALPYSLLPGLVPLPFDL